MKPEEIALSVMRGLVKRPRLADAVFRFDKWGNILGPDRFVDPYPIYERMRMAGPVSFSPMFQQWAIVGYEEAREVLSSPNFGTAAQLDLILELRPYSELADQTKALLRNALLFTDPPLHTRLRSVVSRAFTPLQMRRLEPRITEIADRLLANLADDKQPDLMEGFAQPLPINVISELIGVPEERWAWVAQTSTKLREVLDPFVVVDPASIDAMCEELHAYYGELAEERLEEPRDDLITSLVQADPRSAKESMTIAGKTIKSGQNLTIMLGAVNRDPRRYTNPNQLMLDRKDPAGLFFGHGIHHCIGAALARLELRIGLRAVLNTFGDYTVDYDQLAWKKSLSFRSPTKLLIRPA